GSHLPHFLPVGRRATLNRHGHSLICRPQSRGDPVVLRVFQNWTRVLLLVATSACYRYTPITAEPENVGAEVRLRLTDAGSVQLAPMIGSQVESIDGR